MEILKRTQHKQNIVREIPIFIPITQTFWEIERRILFFFGYKILKAQQKKGKQMKKNESRKELRTSSLKQGDECEVFLHL